MFYLLFSFLVIGTALALSFSLLRKKNPKLDEIEAKRMIEKIEEDHYLVKHTCGLMTPVRKRFVVSQSFDCIHCHKKVIPREVRCPRCNSLVKLKNHTPLFHSPLQCKACKKKFELPGRSRINDVDN